MDLHEAIKLRHSVRQYRDIPLDEAAILALFDEIARINEEADLHFQLVLNEPKAFSSKMAHYGKFKGVSNYFALVGKKSKDLFEKCGYFGERLVLRAQQLGLHTCWVALTYKKIPDAFKVLPDERFCVVISVGHGRHRGLPRRSKTPEQVSNISDSTPIWFKNGVDSALLAPTAMNQQKFKFIYNDDNTVSAKCNFGFYTKMDLGIAKYHFEIGAGRENFRWK